MAAFYTWLDFTLTLEMRVVIEHLRGKGLSRCIEVTPLDKTGLILVYGKNIGIIADFIHRAICPVLCQTQ